MQSSSLIQPRTRKGLKRSLDLLIGLPLLLLSFPVILLLSFYIYLLSPGPFFFSQYRVGLRGKRFKIYKIRTMHPLAEKRLREYLDGSPEAQAEWSNYQKLKNDPRVIKYTQWIRRFSLDELPQFFNIIKGDMSLVGPRPFEEGLYLKLKKDKKLKKKLEVIEGTKPGLTGKWQTEGRNLLTLDERLALDENYVKKPSLRQDFKIISRTPRAVIRSKGAF